MRFLFGFLLFPFLLAPVMGADQLVTTTPIATGINSPVYMDHAGDGSGRLFIVQRGGLILVQQNGTVLPAPFLDIQDRVGCCDERGLLGTAFHPDYPENGFFFVNYTNSDFDTVISRFQVSADVNLADAASEQVLLTIEQPFANHNGGQLDFGPDGYLYIGMGDGGGAGDPLNLAQDRLSLLGKMLRIDVDSGSPYTIPADNPFAFTDFTLDEIWALGLRNPFRHSFDRITGDLYIADVGQDSREEVHVHLANTVAGENFGWRLMEGSLCFNPGSACNDGSLTLPAFDYDHSQGRCSITGGYVYRGANIQSLAGAYIYGDFCTGEIFSAARNASGVWEQQVLLDSSFEISSFGEDEAGELYVADINGSIHQLVAPLSISPPSGNYLQSQFIDLSLILRIENQLSISVFDATLDGTQVGAALEDCVITGILAAGGTSFRCPGVPLSLLTPGEHEFSVTLTTNDQPGIQVSDTVRWNILANSEL